MGVGAGGGHEKREGGGGGGCNHVEGGCRRWACENGGRVTIWGWVKVVGV